jgi:hypothetical protein
MRKPAAIKRFHSPHFTRPGNPFFGKKRVAAARPTVLRRAR